MKIWEAFLEFLRKVLPKKEETIPSVHILPIQEDPLWLIIARKEIGVKEFIPGDNPKIKEYHSATWLKADLDSVAWCAAFVSWCLEKAGIRSARSPRAKDYLAYGNNLNKPKLGCICVFTREGGGHVGFYLGETEDSIKVLGGNQSNAVSIAYYSKANLLGYRWPNAL